MFEPYVETQFAPTLAKVILSSSTNVAAHKIPINGPPKPKAHLRAKAIEPSTFCGNPLQPRPQQSAEKGESWNASEINKMIARKQLFRVHAFEMAMPATISIMPYKA
ncbi:hypothetical protein [Mesorhizobium sp. STM 4661]|uniref:hypothetical protein n=1 Tax=Mesorhizobium sp. STM 4661 TaxID=1297570 RepID=UPI0002BE4C82|nr:hypothetical protein [Mesorhizobium sp. STM 4661]CCV12772.1 hypothetical protein MESS4_50019 [Mesorhizobium sp. STM 4661]